MRLFLLLALLVVSGFVYRQAAEIETLQSSVLGLQKELGTVGNATDALSGELQNVASVASSTAASAEKLTKQGTQDQTLQRAVAAVAPAVVSIVETRTVTQAVVSYVDPLGNGSSVPVYQNTTASQKVSSGTGFLVRTNGYVVTNSHVVSDTGNDITYTVTLASGTKAVAQVLWRDEANDIAILKIAGSGFKAVPLGDSSTLQLGQSVFAVGNALGQYSNSVSTGVISGLGRSIKAYRNDGTTESLSGVIQTDAAINLGNSGGPLVNLSGEAVGVNVATVSNSENISFSIPIAVVKTALGKLGI